MSRKLIASALLVIVVGAACGSSSSGDSKAYVDALVKSKSSSDFTKAMTDAQVRCLATKLVDAVGVDTLKKAGITPDKLAAQKGLEPLKGKITKDQAKQIVDAIISGTCFDFADLIRKQSNDASLNKLSKDKLDCLFKKIFQLPAAQDELANSLVTGSEPDFTKAFGNQSQLFTILGQCNINPNELSA